MKNKFILRPCIGLLFSCLVFCSNAKSINQSYNVNSSVDKEILVATQAELNSAIASANPGNVIVMKDGVWTDVVIDFKSIASATAPITLRAQTPGKVILNGTSSLVFSKPNLIVEGILFLKGTITKKDAAVVFFNSDNCRLTNSAIINYNPADFNTEYYWVLFDGSHNRTDHCYFTGKSNKQPVIQNGEENARYNQVDRCYIKDIPYVAKANGREILRIFGYGHADQAGDDGAYFTVEYNLFDHAHGEGTEIVSLKSNHNIVRYNTVIASKGGLVGRRGKYNTFEGNIILGKGETGTSGIRVAGPYQRVINNYVADVTEDGLRLIAGEYYEKSLTGDFAAKKKNLPKYLQVQNCYFANNSFINCGENGINIGYNYKNQWPSLQMVLFPENNTFVNNLVYNCKENAINIEVLDKKAPLDAFNFKPNFFEGNLAFGQQVCNTSLPIGIKAVDPQIKLGNDGLYRLTTKSPAINAGVDSEAQDDLFANRRDGKKDIGAEAFEGLNPNRQLLTPNEVGPNWLVKKYK
jgi:poly(beta-D-mannuronate) lyase